MTVSVCPSAVVAAPMEHVWALLTVPATYDAWWDATTERIDPPGPAAPGQVIYATARGFGRRWPVNATVVAIDSERHAIDLRTTLPLGINSLNHITVQPVDATRCRLTFG